jgi:hypothetical protein
MTLNSVKESIIKQCSDGSIPFLMVYVDKAKVFEAALQLCPTSHLVLQNIIEHSDIKDG